MKVLTLAFVVALVLATTSAVPKRIQRIVGGSVTNIGQYPYAVSLLFSNNLVNYWQSCGGSILTSTAVLTAAHCTIGDAANRWRARVGSTNANSGGVVHNLRQIINHPSYNSWTFDNDVAVLRTQTTMGFNNNVRAASIAGTNYNLADNQVPGGAASEQLRHVQIWTINQTTCRNRYAEIRRTVTDNMLCSGWLDVGGRDQCQGDSGGPLIHNGVVVGVCSWGESCALARFPGVNARVSRFTTWIQQQSR
ncbi:Trypsin CFT-1 [Eumeta japonica]|uniref:Trypsin CFT-1 n=1 Tax=Eumeta variegata TaxID=151549 RepID=A0A4C1WHG7_EUMVA|nr:Trypsin CFT-1 [Eumeta japonica]